MKRLEDCLNYKPCVDQLGKELVHRAFDSLLEGKKNVIEADFDLFLSRWEVVFFAGYLYGYIDGINFQKKREYE